MPQSQQCLFCAHYRGALSCDAFPLGIPPTILKGQHNHRKPYPGDGGIRYEPVEDAPPAAIPSEIEE